MLCAAAGFNRFGDPNMRAIWGWNRLDWIGGKWADHDHAGTLIRETIGVRREPKYFPTDRWYIERWRPPESFGSPTLWYAQTTEWVDGISVPALGPYPSRGDYEHAATLETRVGGFLQINPNIARYAAQRLEFIRAMRRRSLHEVRSEFVHKQDKDYDSFADSVLTDAVPAFHGMPHATVL